MINTTIYNYIFFGGYLVLLFIIFGFLIIFLIHIKDYKQYSRYITNITRIYLTLMILIAIFGWYHILTGKIFPQKEKVIQRHNF